MSKTDRGALIFAAIILSAVFLTGCTALEAAGGILPATQADIDRLDTDAAALNAMARNAAEAGDDIGTILYSAGGGLASLLAAIGLSRRRRKNVILKEKMDRLAAQENVAT